MLEYIREKFRELHACVPDASWRNVDRYSDHAKYWPGSVERVEAASSVIQKLTELKALAATVGVPWTDVDPEHTYQLPRNFL